VVLMLPVGLLLAGAEEPARAVAPLVIVPVGVCAAVFGLRGALGAVGLAAVALTAVRASDAVAGRPVNAWDYGARLLSLALVGLTVGFLADRMRLTQRRLAAHQSSARDLIATLVEGHFAQVNPAFERILGYREEDLRGRAILEFVHPEDRDATLAEQRVNIQGPGAGTEGFRHRFAHRDGSYRWLEWSVSYDHASRTSYAVAREVGERVRAEERLQDAVQERTRALQAQTAALEETRLEMLRRLALAGEYRDEDTHQHTERVGRIAGLLAELLGCERGFVELIRLAAPLHDLGKLAVSDAILLKPGPLSAVEWEQIRRHPIDGARILDGSNSDVLKLAEEIARTHHERWDGTGYPAGLAGEQIPLSGRIVALADTLDALTHPRPYRDAWPADRALAEILSQRGRQFDPAVVDALEQFDLARLVAVSAREQLATAVRARPRPHGPRALTADNAA
jgi:PAS domain S-box-containing protein